MAEKMIRALLFTYGREIDNPLFVEGQDAPARIVVEGLAHLGDVVDISRPYDLMIGEKYDAFFTDEQRAAIEDGTYTGIDAPSIYQARLQAERSKIEPAIGEGTVDASQLSTEELAEHIQTGNNGKPLNVAATIELAGDGDDIDRINKVLDAENMAMQEKGGPRSGVVDALEKRLATANA